MRAYRRAGGSQVRRGRLEERVLRGDYAGSRAEYWSCRGAYGNKFKYLVGLLLVLVSPRLLRGLLVLARPRTGTR